MAKERKKPGPKPIPIDYDAVAFFCRSQIPDAALARKLNISPQVLSNRLKRDPKLREAREGGAWDGKNIVSDAMFRKMLDRYMTICKDCQKIRFSFEKFYDKCPYCDQSRPIDPETGLDEYGNDHTNVKHKFIPGRYKHHDPLEQEAPGHGRPSNSRRQPHPAIGNKCRDRDTRPEARPLQGLF